MARRGRPKKSKQVTYDSQETKFVMAVIAFGLAIFSLLSYVIVEDDSIFGIIRAIFGESTVIFALFMFNLSLNLFGINFFLNTRKSLISQIIFLLFSAVFIANNSDPNPIIAKNQGYNGEYGGIVGYEIAHFSKEYLLLNLTGVVSFLGMVLFLPSIFNQNIAQFFSNVGRFMKGMYDFVFNPAPREENLEGEPEQEQMSRIPMVGDLSFNRKQQPESIDDAENSEIKAPDFVGMPSNISAKKNNINAAQVDSTNVSSEQAFTGELKYPDWQLPPSSLLNDIPDLKIPKEDTKNNSTIIEQTLASFGIESKVMEVSVGPSVTQYALDIALGIKVSKIANLRNDIALALATNANAVRIEVPIPGTSYVGIEAPNKTRRPVYFKEIIDEKEMNDPDHTLPVTVGKGIAGNTVVADIQDLPHLLIAGATGSGKSVLTTAFITSILMKRTPDEVRFILVDPKQVELSDFNGIPHLLTPVIVDMDKVINALKWAVAEMERRYTIFREEAVKDLKSYNKKKGFSALPFIVVVIDEMADMMLAAGRADIETNIVRLAQKARATGIHLILATQRPSVNVITGIIKANIPGRIGMSVTTQVDSRVILDIIGAESLLGRGDMLFKEPDKNKPNRVQGVFVTQDEIQSVVGFIKDQTESVEYVEEVVSVKDESGLGPAAAGLSGDNLLPDAIRIVVAAQKGSSSLLQRKLSIGYNRAAKLLDDLGDLGVVGAPNGSKPRDVLVSDAEGFIQQLQQS